MVEWVLVYITSIKQTKIHVNIIIRCVTFAGLLKSKTKFKAPGKKSILNIILLFLFLLQRMCFCFPI